MNKLSPEKRASVLSCLIEGNSIASTSRMTGAAKMTVLSLIAEVGKACVRFHDSQVRYLSSRFIQCDEVWSFCFAKEKNVPVGERGKGKGSIWTWTALDSDSKLMVSWLMSDRSQAAADALMADLHSRILHPVHITSDGYSAYLSAILKAFREGEVHYAECIKTYGSSGNQPDVSPNSAASRYSPGRVTGVEKRPHLGWPFEDRISTSHMERWNLTLRMQNRRFTRLTNAFSKKLENHAHMLAITMVYYNFCRKHRSLKGKTPAMVAGLTENVWSVSDLLSLDMWFAEKVA